MVELKVWVLRPSQEKKQGLQLGRPDVLMQSRFRGGWSWRKNKGHELILQRKQNFKGNYNTFQIVKIWGWR